MSEKINKAYRLEGGAEVYEIESRELSEAIKRYNLDNQNIKSNRLSWIAAVDLQDIAKSGTAGIYDAVHFAYWYGFMKGRDYETEYKK